MKSYAFCLIFFIALLLPLNLMAQSQDEDAVVHVQKLQADPIIDKIIDDISIIEALYPKAISDDKSREFWEGFVPIISTNLNQAFVFFEAGNEDLSPFYVIKKTSISHYYLQSALQYTQKAAFIFDDEGKKNLTKDIEPLLETLLSLSVHIKNLQILTATEQQASSHIVRRPVPSQSPRAERPTYKVMDIKSGKKSNKTFKAANDKEWAKIKSKACALDKEYDAAQFLFKTSSSHYFTTEQVASIIDCFVYPHHRIRALSYLFSRLIDPHNWWQVVQALPFDSEKENIYPLVQGRNYLSYYEDRRIVTDHEFAVFINALRQAHLYTERLLILQPFAHTNQVTVDQLVQILDSYPRDSEKADILKLLYFKTIDARHKDRILEVFESETYQEVAAGIFQRMEPAAY